MARPKVASPPAPEAGGRHRRNPRGQGGRLRDDIIQAASEVIEESADPKALSLRGVARKLGIAATSVYLHFPDVEHLAIAVAERHFERLTEARREIEATIEDPCQALLARSRVYCRFALASPTYYQLMFQTPLGPNMTFGFDQAPGRRAFEDQVAAVRRCLEALGRPDEDAFGLATLIWATHHGLVSLRIHRPRFPWPPIEDLAEDAARRIVNF
jgi:AcrR family transcriptional regulator